MSLTPNTIEYAAQNMIRKGMRLRRAAEDTVKKFSGHKNWALGSGVHEFGADELEQALWDRLVDYTIDQMKRVREGKEHFTLDFAMDTFRQKKFKGARAELKERVIEHLGHDPFTNDDVL